MKSTILDTFVAPPCHADLTIVYQDDAILVVDKPSGLLTLSGKNPVNWDSVHHRLVQTHPNALMVHRLDFGTSGLLVVALSKAIAKNLNQQFQMREVKKTYTAMLNGHVTSDSGTIEAAIAKDDLLFPRLKVCANTGKVALTEYRVLQRFDRPSRTKVEYLPQTGRTHQLRIHSQYMGHPILGCDLYGTVQTFELADRLMLHADSLNFKHPVKNMIQNYVSECPF